MNEERKSPGETGEGEYYHVEVESKENFVQFRTQDIGRGGHTQRVAGQRKDGSWATQKWLIHKKDAHLADNGRLIVDDQKAKSIKDQIDGPILHVKGDIFKVQ